MDNVLILNGLDLHKKFIKCIKNKDIRMYNELKDEIINQYSYIAGFNLKESTQDLFEFPNFKTEGNFGELTFEPKESNNDYNNNYNNNFDFDEIY